MPLSIKSKFWVVDEKGQPVFGSGRMAILKKIEELGSIRAAATDLQMSYRAVWGKIKAAEDRLGFKLVQTSPGGGKNRGARLTEEAQNLLSMFSKLQHKGNKDADKLFLKIFKP